MRRMPLPEVVGLLAAAANIALVLLVISAMLFSGEPDWPMGWLLPMYVAVPVLVLWLLLRALPFGIRLLAREAIDWRRLAKPHRWPAHVQLGLGVALFATAGRTFAGLAPGLGIMLESHLAEPNNFWLPLVPTGGFATAALGDLVAAASQLVLGRIRPAR